MSRRLGLIAPTVGLLVASEAAFPSALAYELQRRNATVDVRLLQLGSQTMDAPLPAGVIIDRASYRAPYLNSALKRAAVAGAHVVNDPFWALAEDRFVAARVAAAAGVPSAGLMVLPNRAHVAGVVEDSLRNRAAHPRWHEAIDELGWPVVWKPINPGPEPRAAILRTADDLLALWEASGTDQYVLQRYVPEREWLRVLVAGGDALPLDWDPVRRTIGPRGIRDDDEALVAAGMARTAAVALGRGIGGFDFGVIDGSVVAIDLVQYAPPLARAVSADGMGADGLAAEGANADAFAWLVDRSARLVLELLSRPPRDRYRWDALRAP